MVKSRRGAKGPPPGSSEHREKVVAQAAVNAAGSASRQATRKFYDTLDGHMRGSASERSVLESARVMWRATEELRRLEGKHGLKVRKKPPQPPRSPEPRGRANLFGVRQVLPGSFESGKNR